MLDLVTALVIEVYQELGMKFDEATGELAGKLLDPDDPETPTKRAPTPSQEKASMAMLQSMMGGSSFRGPKG